jgi:hypothetical protein
MRWPGHVARIGKMRNSYKIVVTKPGRKKLLGRSGWEDDIQMDFRNIA